MIVFRWRKMLNPWQYMYAWQHPSFYWNIKLTDHDEIIKWKNFPRHWPFVRGIHRSPWVILPRDSDNSRSIHRFNCSLTVLSNSWKGFESVPNQFAPELPQATKCTYSGCVPTLCWWASLFSTNWNFYKILVVDNAISNAQTNVYFWHGVSDCKLNSWIFLSRWV